MGCQTCTQQQEGGSILSSFPDKASELEQHIDSLEITHNISRNRGHLIHCLHKAQELFGYLPEDVQLLIAKKLRLNLSDVYGVISFYSFFTTNPPGKYKINICLGTACFVKGADKILKEFEKRLGIKDGETTEDLKFSLGGLRCVGACSLAPVVIVNGKVYAKVDPGMVEGIIKDCDKEQK
ncbi:MAG: NAD(P)H-dependent oxidoreductase subunit E [Victivallales bacterium]|nr:NAD(P)H-dependent oxidoreductase subunit E [Victivallales bacterium]